METEWCIYEKHFVLDFITFFFFSPSYAWSFSLQTDKTHYEIDPSTLKISANDVIVNNPHPVQEVNNLEIFPLYVTWHWPQKDIDIVAQVNGEDLRLTFKSARSQTLNWFSMPPHINMLELPLGEGSQIPLSNADWLSYLTEEVSNIDTNFDLKLPLWGLEKGDNVFSWIVLSPFNNQISFTKTDKSLKMDGSHIFNKFNQDDPFEVILHVGTSKLSGAISYRKYLQDTGQFSSLSDKIAISPEGNKLIGATHIYLWGNTLLAQEDVNNWSDLVNFLRSPDGNNLMKGISHEDRAILRSLTAGEPQLWQKQSLIEAINNALIALVPLNSSPDSPTFLMAQHQQAEKVRLLAERLLGKFLLPSDQWGPGLSESVIKPLKDAGLSRLWLGTDNWTAAFLHPQAVIRAKESGYLIASYDSYDTGIPRGLNDSWLTAQLPKNLVEKCAIVRADGTKKPGFGKQGYYLNPGCVLPFSQHRMREIVGLAALNSLFLDVDGTGMVSDDYHPEHPISSEQMAADRNARMAWFVNAFKLPLGSEDGNAVTARHLMFAHGMETWGFGWRDRDMRYEKKSQYYLGAWWPSSQPATFFTPAKVKEQYQTVVFDPRYRLPLYQAVFHDSVITSHHWTFDNLKFSDVKTTRSLLSQLYNTPPLFNLSRGTLKERLPEIIKADASFRILHSALWDKALTDFSWLDSSGLVQETKFSDGSVLTANFSDRKFKDISGHTLRAELSDGRILNFGQD
ncbi:glycoside hydrolase [Type-D symbiont of Plautia stali]|uniref:glycoside hydrolase n=1 Tax=Type-D symbiont of Plautia stali TaxID=1560356 RepID=UPI00073F6660|nr:glycoside hydrolase [Type-D symbiont of Plautia stali]